MYIYIYTVNDIINIARNGCFGEAILVTCFSAWYTWDADFCELLWSCAAELASPCENAPHQLVALPNVLCASVILSSLAMFVGKNTSRPWFTPSHFKISCYSNIQQSCAVRAVGVFFAALPIWLSTIIPTPFQPRHSAKSCTIFASRSFRIPQKFWWACVASKTPCGHFPHTQQACETMKWSTMIYKLNRLTHRDLTDIS